MNSLSVKKKFTKLHKSIKKSENFLKFLSGNCLKLQYLEGWIQFPTDDALIVDPTLGFDIKPTFPKWKIKLAKRQKAQKTRLVF